jgi:lipocalin
MASKGDGEAMLQQASKLLTSIAATAALSAALVVGAPSAFAENELSAKYGGKGFDTSLVDQTCLVDKCSLQAKACLADDPDCRKGLTCTAKCLGDNACITGCMARYGDSNLDNLLKCTIEDNECIKVAILDGGADKYGEEPRPPAPTVRNFNLNSMEGQWYKVVGFNPNYDCYACQKNTFSLPEEASSSAGLFSPVNNKLEVDVQFSMPRMMPDGTPPPPSNVRETIKQRGEDGLMYGSQSIGFNDYQTHEIMVFDNVKDSKSQLFDLVLGKGTDNEVSYSRTAHSEGEMFGLKFWENWYIIGENDPDQPEFKFVYYNGKTRQNTYDGAFVYSRTKELGPEAMQKVYKIASEAGMNPDQFCKIRNGCFKDEGELGTPTNPFRGILASTKISQLLGVEPVAAEGVLKSTQTATAKLGNDEVSSKRSWWYEVGDYLEDPARHFKAMDSLRITMDWPEDVKQQK